MPMGNIPLQYALMRSRGSNADTEGSMDILIHYSSKTRFVQLSARLFRMRISLSSPRVRLKVNHHLTRHAQRSLPGQL